MSDNPIADVDFATISPSDFAQLVKSTPKSQINELMGQEEIRAAVLDAIFDRMGSQYKGSRKTSAVVHWKILDRPDGEYDLYETVLDNGECVVNKDGDRDPRVTIKLNAEQFLNLASGNGSPPMMFFSGKLKLQGDVGFAASLGNLFNIPKA
ncbi:SCP2 sterol-binding domain-containing protein [Haloglycomyces albus]|uniref:SCP2 sterol-binding domain-containing protein n=1 Tax=Haloglycomyces albus TaxID=526067 RepID=UPI00046D0B4A|nr:SCP2 sterol-binding domain-containing protein [Haloglycomyces albus]